MAITVLIIDSYIDVTLMLDLPYSNTLPVRSLSSCFDDVTNSYKFYWFLSILEHIRGDGGPIIRIDALLADMIASVWYPSNYFYLSFGKQDRLSQSALKIKEASKLSIDSKKKDIIREIYWQLQSDSRLTSDILSLRRYVPFRFLRPFFDQQLRRKNDSQINALITNLAEDSFFDTKNQCIYRFVGTTKESIEIQPDWFAYLREHIHILDGFCMWHLLNYLQKNNPNVPNIAGKLFEPAQRNLKQAKIFWQLAFDHLGEIKCIYSGQVMSKESFSLDHFLPWRFVAHDLLWNIVPTPQNINSAKNDNLPDMDKYFDLFAELQFTAICTAMAMRKMKLLEDYLVLFRAQEFSDPHSLSFDSFRQTLADTIMPQLQIARNMGFSSDWSYATL